MGAANGGQARVHRLGEHRAHRAGNALNAEARADALDSRLPPGIIMPLVSDIFAIALIGDFTGRADRGLIETGKDLARRRRIPVDRDNVEELPGQLGVELAGIKFRNLDDFHPDRLLARVPLFQSLRELREKMEDPAEFARLAARAAPAQQKTAPPPPPARAVPANLLDQMVEEEAEDPVDRISGRPDAFQQFLERIVAPHLVPGADPRQKELIAKIDSGIGDQMREVIHHPDLQGLEAAWRALGRLARNIETDVTLKLYLYDISKQELAADLLNDLPLEQTGLHKLLVDQTVGTPGAQTWAVLAGNYTFGPGEGDLKLLARIARIAKASGAPWISGADSRLAGCPSLARTPDPDDWTGVPLEWQALRRIPEAASVGLALPRFLLRAPYGAKSDPCATFRFEELSGSGDHDGYLWGNAAFACVEMLAEAFTEDGWSLEPGVNRDLRSLPFYTYQEMGETIAKPTAEIWMTERAAGRLQNAGLMTLASIKDQDRARLVRFQSIADPVRALAGGWSQ